jgi:hypothetical protein
MFQKNIDEERDKIEPSYNILSNEYSSAFTRYRLFKADGMDEFFPIIKRDLAEFIKKSSQPNNYSSSNNISLYNNSNSVRNIKNFALKNRISEAVGHRRSAIRNAYLPKNNNKNQAEQNKEVMNRVKASNRRAAQQKALENANHAEYNRKTKKNNVANTKYTNNLKNNRRINTLKINRPNVKNNTRIMVPPAAGGRWSTKKRRSS